MHVERMSAVTIRVTDMRRSLHFYRNLLGMELRYGGENSSFSTLRSCGENPSILNLELGSTACGWGRLIFYVADVDAFWAHLKKEGIEGEEPQDATWGERYFHLLDPDGHEVSIAQPLP
jgi:catechol 2,3-dioxygenase-like lactoylglutathione lyase family enzyme